MYAIHAENGAERYCGTMLIPTGMTSDTTNTNRLNPVTTCQRPFRLHHVTGMIICNMQIYVIIDFLFTGAVTREAINLKKGLRYK